MSIYKEAPNERSSHGEISISCSNHILLNFHTRSVAVFLKKLFKFTVKLILLQIPTYMKRFIHIKNMACSHGNTQHSQTLHFWRKYEIYQNQSHKISLPLGWCLVMNEYFISITLSHVLVLTCGLRSNFVFHFTFVHFFTTVAEIKS